MDFLDIEQVKQLEEKRKKCNKRKRVTKLKAKRIICIINYDYFSNLNGDEDDHEMSISLCDLNHS